MGRAVVVALALFGQTAHGQERGAAALANALDLLRHDVPRVLYIAAHPDDENTRLITWIARGGYGEVAYLSLTRGEGGQNLIGGELGDALGVLRTQELLAARRIDGARQYFTRAYDFGYSKTADEAFTHWPRDSILGDVIRVVRAFRPHVLVSTFSGTPLDQHGQHQVSGILTRDAYELAADTVRFPVHEFGPAWEPLKLYRMATFSPRPATLRVNVGEFNPLIGRSYDEIASESRSQHKSQDFRVNHRLGAVWTLLRREATRVNPDTPAERERSIFDNIAAAARRTASNGGSGAPSQPVDLRRPASAAPVIGAFTPHDAAERARYERAAVLASGVVLEALAERPFVAVGDSVPVTYTLYNRGTMRVRLRDAPGAMPMTWVLPGNSVSWTVALTPAAPTRPWWLAAPRRGDLYSTPAGVISADERDREGWARVSLEIGALREPVTVATPIVLRFSEPIYGDVYRGLVAAPGLTVTPDRDRRLVRAGAEFARDVTVTIHSSFAAERRVAVRVNVPAGLVVEPREPQFTIPGGALRTLTFRVTGKLPAGDHRLAFRAESSGQSFAEAVQVVDYPHIVPQRLYRPARVDVTSIPVNVPSNLTVGYVTGTADEGPHVLRELGIPVTVIEPRDLSRTGLTQFSTVVVGPRAYEAHAELREHSQRLFDYVNAGGRLVVQFGQYMMSRPGILPFPITITRPPDRVTDENAPVMITDPGARELTFPNRITQADFEGWLQERATFMPTDFDPRYRTMLAMNDPGEPPKLSSILVAQLGRGTYVYTTLALFRQMSEGVPGAVRLFVNLLTPQAP